MARILFARPDAGRLLSISLRKLDQLIKTKMLNGVKVGKRTLIPHAELQRFARCGTAVKQNGGRHAE
jgi:excisionase family DNA binding protein